MSYFFLLFCNTIINCTNMKTHNICILWQIRLMGESTCYRSGNISHFWVKYDLFWWLKYILKQSLTDVLMCMFAKYTVCTRKNYLIWLQSYCINHVRLLLSKVQKINCFFINHLFLYIIHNAFKFDFHNMILFTIGFSYEKRSGKDKKI